MNDNEYLSKVLESQTLADHGDEMKALESHRKDVDAILRKNYGTSPTIKYGGSKAKGTMIKEAYDLDVICYFNNDDTGAGETLKDIYYNVRDVFQSTYLVREKSSALRLKSLDPGQYGIDFHIDVVPGRYTDDSKSDTFLYISSGEKCRQKTNLDVHIEHVRNSGVIDAIRLVKLWRVRNSLSVRHFVLELLTIKLLKNRKTSSLTNQLEHVWMELRDNVNDLVVEDPANPNGNDLSELFDATVKCSLSSVATSTLQMIELNGWESVFGQVEEMTSSEKVVALQQAAASVRTASKPWLPLL
jgi:hypothetical protein